MISVRGVRRSFAPAGAGAVVCVVVVVALVFFFFVLNLLLEKQRISWKI